MPAAISAPVFLFRGRGRQHRCRAIRQAIAEAKAYTDQPPLIKVKPVIGFGSPNKAGSHDAHGAPLGPEKSTATRDQLGGKFGEFDVPDGVYDVFRQNAAEGTTQQVA